MDAGGSLLIGRQREAMTTNQQPKKSKDVTGTLISIGLVVLIPLALFFYLRSSGFDVPGIKEMPKKDVQTAPEADAKPAPKARAIREFDLRTEDERRDRVRIPARAEAAERPRPEVRVRTFPTPAMVPAGMRKSDLISSFGRPNVVTTAVDEGRATETFVYLQRGTDMGTVVRLQGGVVVTSTTAAY
jgi:hypothetical protein